MRILRDTASYPPGEIGFRVVPPRFLKPGFSSSAALNCAPPRVLVRGVGNPSMARKMLVDGEVAAVAEGGQYDYDLFVIGAGSGGVRGSRTAASFGAKVRWFFTPTSSALTLVLGAPIPEPIRRFNSVPRPPLSWSADGSRLPLTHPAVGSAVEFRASMFVPIVIFRTTARKWTQLT